MAGGRPRRYSAHEVAEALQATGGNATAAARLLGCDRVTVWRYLQRQQAKKRTRVRVGEDVPAAPS